VTTFTCPNPHCSASIDVSQVAPGDEFSCPQCKMTFRRKRRKPQVALAAVPFLAEPPSPPQVLAPVSVVRQRPQEAAPVLPAKSRKVQPWMILAGLGFVLCVSMVTMGFILDFASQPGPPIHGHCPWCHEEIVISGKYREARWRRAVLRCRHRECGQTFRAQEILP
jgi:hypothetical protein